MYDRGRDKSRPYIKCRAEICNRRSDSLFYAGEDARVPTDWGKAHKRVAALGANAAVQSALPAKPEGLLNGFNRYRILELMLWRQRQ